MLIVFFAFMTSSGCKQQEFEAQKVVNAEKIDILTLRKYFAEQINVDLNDIVYDEKTQQFSLWGVDQISLEKLTKFYLNAKGK